MHRGFLRGFALGGVAFGVLFLLLAASRPPVEVPVPVQVEVPRPVPVYVPAGTLDRAWVLHLTATAYSSRPEETDSSPFVTAAGTRVRPGIVAVSRDLEAIGLVFGARVVLVEATGPGCGKSARALIGKVLVVEDRMHRRKRRQIDVWMPTTEAARAFGRCRVTAVALLPTGAGGPPAASLP